MATCDMTLPNLYPFYIRWVIAFRHLFDYTSIYTSIKEEEEVITEECTIRIEEREAVIEQPKPRAEESKMSRTPTTTECLYCRIQLTYTAEFCSQCGRPIERDFAIRPIQESEFDSLLKEMKKIEGLLRHQGSSSEKSHPQTQAQPEESYP